MPAPDPSPVVRFLRFLGKVQFTMVLLLFGTVVMTAGTILEASEGRSYAAAFVYRTAWFDLFLFLIAVNLVVAVLNRIPIKRHQWAFVVTHFSIVLLLFGAWISRTFGYEGLLVVAEGRESHALQLDATQVHCRWRPSQGPSLERTLPLPQDPRLSNLTLTEGGSMPQLVASRLLENGLAAVVLEDAGAEGLPGIEFDIAGMGLHGREWLLAGHPDFRRKDLGPVEVEFVVLSDPRALEARLAERKSGGAAVVVSPQGSKEAIRLPLPDSLGRPRELADGTAVTVKEYLPEAKIVDGKLRNVPGSGANPAAVVELRRGPIVETHKVFALFPSFDTVRRTGARDEAPPLAEHVRLEAVAAGSKPLVTILHDGKKSLYIQLSASIGRGPGLQIVPGQAIEVGNIGLEFKLERFVPSARPKVVVQAAPPGRKDGRTFLELVAAQGGREESFWLLLDGPSESCSLAGGVLEASFRHAVRELPFSLHLKDFRIEYYPGSMRPRSYESHVRVVPRVGSAPAAETVIAMNRPLDYMGFRLFQSSYILGSRGEPDRTVLSVSYDPGVSIVYVSFILIILGVAWYLRSHGGPRPAVGATPRRKVGPGTSEGGAQQ